MDPVLFLKEIFTDSFIIFSFLPHSSRHVILMRMSIQKYSSAADVMLIEVSSYIVGPFEHKT